jgi:hypothetical protein
LIALGGQVYGPLSLCAIHKEGLCLSGDIKRLMMTYGNSCTPLMGVLSAMTLVLGAAFALVMAEEFPRAAPRLARCSAALNRSRGHRDLHIGLFVTIMAVSRYAHPTTRELIHEIHAPHIHNHDYV